jgi:hypothetical protein
MALARRLCAGRGTLQQTCDDGLVFLGHRHDSDKDGFQVHRAPLPDTDGYICSSQLRDNGSGFARKGDRRRNVTL